jgi:hypothetical protein
VPSVSTKSPQKIFKKIFANKIFKYGNFNYGHYYPAITVNLISVGSKDPNLVKTGAYDE